MLAIYTDNYRTCLPLRRNWTACLSLGAFRTNTLPYRSTTMVASSSQGQHSPVPGTCICCYGCREPNISATLSGGLPFLGTLASLLLLHIFCSDALNTGSVAITNRTDDHKHRLAPLARRGNLGKDNVPSLMKLNAISSEKLILLGLQPRFWDKLLRI